MRRRTAALLGGGAVAAALALGSLFGGVLTEPRPTGATAQAAPRVDLETALSGFGRGSGTAATVAKLEAELGSGSSDPDRLGSLGLAYQLRWRETGDPTFLPLSERALRRALAARPDDPAVTLGLGNLALIRHDFRAALELGRRARRLAPDASRPYGVVGDALLELGRYDEAFAAFDRMVAVKPTLASYARIAYARELTGDRAGAISAMTLALDAAGGAPEPTAWTHVELAKLELGSGRVDRAARHVGAALTIFPGYVLALEQRARIEAARGKLDAAVATAARAATAVPLPQLVALHGDLLERQGRKAEARRQRAVVGAIDRLLETNGLSVDLESAVYRADHRIAPEATVRLARRAQADRPSIHGDDALGWALARAGRCDEATPLARPLAPARDEGRAPLLPSRLRGRVRGRPASDAHVVPQGARARPELFDPLGPRGSARARAEPIPRRERRSRMKRLAVVLAVAVTALVATGVAAAHPLGNFTTNHYAEVVLSGDRAYVHYVLDLAEIPTFQARGDVTALGRERYADRLAKAVASGLAVSVDGRTRRLVAVERRLAFPPGAAGLRTTRFELVLAAGEVRRGAEHSVSVRNAVYAERLGWRELVIRADGGATIESATAPSRGISARLLSYPQDRLSSPLDVRAAEARFAPGDDVVVPSLETPSEAAAPRTTTASEGGFARLIEQQELTFGVVALALLVAMFWGAAHALTPGHGKAIVTAYLVGTRGRPRDALLLGGIVTVTHTIGVFALGFVTLGLSEFIVPEDLYPWLNLVSAVLVVLVGLAVFRLRILAALRPAGRPPSRRPSASPPRSPSPPRGHDGGGARARPSPAGGEWREGAHRRRHLGRADPVPDGARRPPRRDLAPPRRVRPRPDRRLQRRARRGGLRHRTARDRRAPDLQPHELRRAARSSPPDRERPRDPRRRRRDDLRALPGIV